MTYYDHATRIALETKLQNDHRSAKGWQMERDLAEQERLSVATQPTGKAKRLRRAWQSILGVFRLINKDQEKPDCH